MCVCAFHCLCLRAFGAAIWGSHLGQPFGAAIRGSQGGMPLCESSGTQLRQRFVDANSEAFSFVHSDVQLTLQASSGWPEAAAEAAQEPAPTIADASGCHARLRRSLPRRCCGKIGQHCTPYRTFHHRMPAGPHFGRPKCLLLYFMESLPKI